MRHIHLCILAASDVYCRFCRAGTTNTADTGLVAKLDKLLLSQNYAKLVPNTHDCQFTSFVSKILCTRGESATVCLLHLAFLENNNEQHVETNEVFCKEFDRHDISCTLSPHSL